MGSHRTECNSGWRGFYWYGLFGWCRRRDFARGIHWRMGNRWSRCGCDQGCGGRRDCCRRSGKENCESMKDIQRLIINESNTLKDGLRWLDETAQGVLLL